MSFLNKLFRNKTGPVSIVLSVIISVLFVVAVVEAATTISSNISTDGTLLVTGASTLTGIVTTGDNIIVPAAYGLDTSTAGVLNIGTSTATSLNIADTGVLTTIRGTLNVDEAVTFDTTLGVTGVLTAIAGIVSGNNITVPAAYGLDAAGAGALNIGTTTATSINYGGSSVTAHTFTSDGTGTAEVVLPAGSIDSTELLDGTVAKADMATAFMTIGIVEDGTSGWDPNSATVLFLVTADASAIALDSLVLISLSVNNDNIQCFVTKLVTSVNFMVVCNAAPLNGARLHYMIIN